MFLYWLQVILYQNEIVSQELLDFLQVKHFHAASKNCSSEFVSAVYLMNFPGDCFIYLSMFILDILINVSFQREPVR